MAGYVWKNVTSRDPEKQAIQDRLSKAAGLAPGVGRVTCVKRTKSNPCSTKPRLIKGDVLRKYTFSETHHLPEDAQRHTMRSYKFLGTFELPLVEVEED